MPFSRFFAQLLMVVVAALVVSVAWQSVPLIQARLLGWNAAPRLVAARGDLASDEKSTIAIFQQAARQRRLHHAAERVVDLWTRSVREIPRGTGSGFVWDTPATSSPTTT